MAKKRLLVTTGAAVVALGLGAWSTLRRPDAAQFRTAAAECGPIASTVSATGTPNAVVTVQVGSQVSGNILALYADFNTPVKKGQVVARIDPEIYQARVDQAKATLAAQQAAVVNAQAQIEKSRADVSSAQAAVANAQANATRSESAASDAKIKNARRIELVAEGVMSVEDGETAVEKSGDTRAVRRPLRHIVFPHLSPRLAGCGYSHEQLSVLALPCRVVRPRNYHRQPAAIRRDSGFIDLIDDPWILR